MCRSIKRLRDGDEVASAAEIEAAARQFVRKVSGLSKPTSRHAEAFDAAIAEISAASRRLLEAVATNLGGGRHHDESKATRTETVS